MPVNATKAYFPCGDEYASPDKDRRILSQPTITAGRRSRSAFSDHPLLRIVRPHVLLSNTATGRAMAWFG